MSNNNNNNNHNHNHNNDNDNTERLDDYLARHPMHVLGATTTNGGVGGGGGGGGGAGGIGGGAGCGFSGEHLVLAHQLDDLSRRLANLEAGRACTR
jgi:hypothetical protein